MELRWQLGKRGDAVEPDAPGKALWGPLLWWERGLGRVRHMQAELQEQRSRPSASCPPLRRSVPQAAPGRGAATSLSPQTHEQVLPPRPRQPSPVTAFAGFSLAARRHSRVRPKVAVLSYACPTTALSRPLNETALTPLTEQEGEAYLEKCGSVRRHTVANAHSDIQLLAMATMMHSGLGEEPGSEDKCLLLPPSFSPPHRQCSSEPNITDSPDVLEQVTVGSQEDSELNCASLS